MLIRMAFVILGTPALVRLMLVVFVMVLVLYTTVDVSTCPLLIATAVGTWMRTMMASAMVTTRASALMMPLEYATGGVPLMRIQMVSVMMSMTASGQSMPVVCAMDQVRFTIVDVTHCFQELKLLACIHRYHGVIAKAMWILTMTAFVTMLTLA